MTSFRVFEAVQRAGRHKRPARVFLGLAAALASTFLAPPTASAQTIAADPQTVQAQAVQGFYAARAARPLWLAPGNEQAARDLVGYLATASIDGLDSGRYPLQELQRALRGAWGGNATARLRAELILSQAFVDYVRDLRRAPDIGMIYVDPQLRPAAPSPRALLDEAAAAPSLERYVAQMGWMHPYYGELRAALAQSADERQRALLAVNLERARTLPPASAGRYVLVNAAAQRLYMFDHGAVQDTMRVVVGKPHQQTPMMAGLIRFTSLNPYWNVPPDLTAERIAPNVLKDGPTYLKTMGYQVLSDWTDNAAPVDPATVDWKAVAEGRKEIRVRQLPGRANSMGAMKFMFPNDQGVYLHDTPATELFSEAARFFSGGCVRLEAAPRLAKWLYGEPLQPSSATPEQRVDLPGPVPVYITYLTAVPGEAGELAIFEDGYGRDAARLAQLSGGQSREVAASR